MLHMAAKVYSNKLLSIRFAVARYTEYVETYISYKTMQMLPSGRLTLNTFEIQSYFLLFVATIMLKNLVKA